MDTIPVQEIPTQQVPVVPPLSQKNNFRKFFNLSSWIILFTLLPFTVLIFLSQDSIPGDLFYPVKRSLENVVLAAASVNPATRAAFRTDLTERRFEEAQSLVVSRSNASGLATFVDDVQSTQLEVANLKDETERIKAEEKLIDKLEEYQAGLSTLEAKTEQKIIAYNLVENIPPTSTPPPAESDSAPTTTPNQDKTSQIIAPTKIPTPTPTNIPSVISPSSRQIPPTSTPIPTLAPTLTSVPTTAPPPTVPPQPENTQVTEQKKISETIKETREQLKKIRKDLEERKKEERKMEKHEERSESEKDNSDRNK